MKFSTAVVSVLVGCVAVAGCVHSGYRSASVRVSSVWACHGEGERTWQRVDVADADAHRAHGDRVVNERQHENRRCDNSVDVTDRRAR